MPNVTDLVSFDLWRSAQARTGNWFFPFQRESRGWREPQNV